MDYCFDTSAINRLHDDGCRHEIVAGLLSTNHVLVSELNLVEVMTTEAIDRRRSLILLLRHLTRGVMPLLTPTALLRTLTIARFNGISSPPITSDGTCPEAWLALQHPEKFLDEDARQFFYKEKKNIEDRFTNVHRVARVELSDLFPGGRPKSLGQTLRFFCKNPLSFLHTASVLHEGITGKALDMDGMRLLFTDLPEWSLYLAVWAQGMYARAFQNENYGSTRNAGTIDLLFALYLEHCDFLVTDDREQFKALRVMNVLSRRRQPRATVLLYDQFRRRLVLN